MKVRGNRESARGEGEGREETVEKDRGREEGVKRCDNSPTPASKRNEAMVRAVVTTSTSICQVSNSRTCPRRGSARYPLGQQFWNEFRNRHLDVFEGLPQAALHHLPSKMLNSLTCTASLGELCKTSGGLFLTTPS